MGGRSVDSSHIEGPSQVQTILLSDRLEVDIVVVVDGYRPHPKIPDQVDPMPRPIIQLSVGAPELDAARPKLQMKVQETLQHLESKVVALSNERTRIIRTTRSKAISYKYNCRS